MKGVLLVCLQVMCMSENKILRQCFDKEELSDKKRPETVRPVSACRCLCVPAFLSHNTTNRGVFPSVMVSVWSAGSHSLKNALTLVCPSHTHTLTHQATSPPHWSQCSGLGWPASARADSLRSSTLFLLSHLLLLLLLCLLLLFFQSPSLHPLLAVVRLTSFAWAPSGSHPVQSQPGQAHGDPHVQGAVVRPLHQAQ